ncbi:MAG: hypothetical protein KAI24_25770, partial [Planctomycetes bacterium]|nr:hypothetical protein [Planctomycetota bacterium]
MRRVHTALFALLAAHVLLGVARLPGKAIARRVDEVDAYRRLGAARYLLDSAHLDGADAIEWLLQNTDEQAAVLWRWPADGALEFVAALIAPRLLVDERAVPAGATSFAGRTIATGTVPSGARGAVVVQGTEDGGLRLTTR